MKGGQDFKTYKISTNPYNSNTGGSSEQNKYSGEIFEGKKWDTGDSLTWKHMIMNRLHVEQHIHWKLQAGIFFLWDSLLGSGTLVNQSTNS